MKDSGSPDISRMRGVHLQGIRGCSRSRLLQALDNAANGRLGFARRVKYNSVSCHFTAGNTIIISSRFFITKRYFPKIFMKDSGRVLTQQCAGMYVGSSQKIFDQQSLAGRSLNFEDGESIFSGGNDELVRKSFYDRTGRF